MKPNRKIWVFVLVLLLWCGGTSESRESIEDGFALFTPQEAELLQQTEEEWEPIRRTRSISLGPLIVIGAPSVKDTNKGPIMETVSPTEFMVSFKENSAPVDMGTLEIKAKKGIFSKSLTSRLKPYIQGTTIQVEEMKVPRGKFTFNVSIADQNGIKTFKTYRLVVAKK